MSEITVERVVEMDDRIFRILCQIDPDRFDSENDMEAAINNMAAERIAMQLTIEYLLPDQMLPDC